MKRPKRQPAAVDKPRKGLSIAVTIHGRLKCEEPYGRDHRSRNNWYAHLAAELGHVRRKQRRTAADRLGCQDKPIHRHGPDAN